MPAAQPARVLRAVPTQGDDIRLSERLRKGPIASAYALQCAADIAIALRQLHAQGKTHGNVNADTVLVRESSAHLAPGSGEECPQHDVKCFGVVLHQLMHGFDVPPDQALKSMDRLVASATELAHRCISADAAPDMRKVAVEVRVLAMLARQRSAHSHAEPAAAVATSKPAFPAVETSAVLAPATPPDFELRRERSLVPSEEACPKCGSHYVYSSKPRTKIEGLCVKLGMPLQRCHRCYHRYCTMLGFKFGKNAPQRDLPCRY